MIAPPPYFVWQTVERWAPGVNRELWVGMIRATEGIPVGATSWYRSREVNHLAGGHPDSQHRIGLAVDLVVDPRNEDQTLSRLRAQGLVAINEGDHIHVQAWPAGTARRVGLLDVLGI